MAEFDRHLSARGPWKLFERPRVDPCGQKPPGRDEDDGGIDSFGLPRPSTGQRDTRGGTSFSYNRLTGSQCMHSDRKRTGLGSEVVGVSKAWTFRVARPGGRQARDACWLVRDIWSILQITDKSDIAWWGHDRPGCEYQVREIPSTIYHCPLEIVPLVVVDIVRSGEAEGSPQRVTRAKRNFIHEGRGWTGIAPS